MDATSDGIESQPAQSPTAPKTASRQRVVLRYVLTLGCTLLALYAAVYHPWSGDSSPGRLLRFYLTWVAHVSAGALKLFGELVTVSGTSVSGRFSYIVVVDCAALDVQAMFAAAVLAFPSRWFTRVVGLMAGLGVIFLINIARLVALYYAGAHSRALFKTLHEEVFVLVVVGLVCGVFAIWAGWATSLMRQRVAFSKEAA